MKFKLCRNTVISEKIKIEMHAATIKTNIKSMQSQIEIHAEAELSLEQQLDKIEGMENRLQISIFNELTKQLDEIQTTLVQINTHLNIVEFLNDIEIEFKKFNNTNHQ